MISGSPLDGTGEKPKKHPSLRKNVYWILIYIEGRGYLKNIWKGRVEGGIDDSRQKRLC